MYPDRLARLLADYSLRLIPGDVFRIRGEMSALPLIHAAYQAAVERGAFPFVDIALPELDHLRLRHAPYASLDFVSTVELDKVERIDADLWILSAPEPLFSGVTPKRLARWQRAQAVVTDRWAERTGEAERRLRWCAVVYPSPELAAAAKMPFEDFTDLVSRAQFLDAPDPIAAWETLAERQRTMTDYLVECETIRVTAERTDITFSVADRGWFNANGRLNLPDGEVGTSPVEHSANGTITVAFPVVYQGSIIEGIRLTFADGEVVDAMATRGRDALMEMLDTDEGARRLGEFAIATNPMLTACTRCILLDEKIGGTCHFALGRSIPGTGSSNASALHIDMVVDLRQGGRIFADGRLIHSNGGFVGPLEASRPPRWAFWKRF